MGKILAVAFFTGLAGLAAWAICEPFAPPTFGDERWTRWSFLFSLALGGFIGAALGGFSGHAQGSRTHILRGLALGGFLGAIAGTVGLRIGGGIADTFFGPDVFGTAVSSGAALPVRMIARPLVFIPIGALLGLLYGLGSRSVPRAVQGMIGGVLGGLAAGVAFDPVGEVVGQIQLQAQGLSVGEVGAVPRALMSLLIGLGVGLFAGIVEAALKRAWVRLELGRNEGKEWIVDGAQTFLGRSESAHIPLHGDPNVQPMHACIVRDRGTYRIVDGGSPMGIGVNGIRVPEAVLQHGDTINIASFNLRFLQKAGQPVPRQDATPYAPPVAMGLPPQPTAPAPKAPELVAVDGPLLGQRFAVTDRETVVGREGPDIVLAGDSTASRRHAAFRAVGSGIMVRDLGSTNGTIVNSIRVQEMSMQPGDHVRIGASTFRVE